MKVEAILQELMYIERGNFPREALEAAIAQQEAITPHLLQAIEDAPGLLERLATEKNYMLPTYAFYLLAQFRETRASPLIVAFFSQPGRQPVDVMGDFVTEDLGRVLASVSGGDTAPIKSLIENSQINEYTRSSAMVGLLTLFVEGVLSRKEIIDYFRSLFRGGLEKEYSYIWEALISHSSAIYPEELMPEIRQFFADDLANDIIPSNLRWVRRVLAEGKEETLASLRAKRHYHYVNDTISEMEWWHCFQPPQPTPTPSPPPESSPSPSQVTPSPAPPPKKVGRNDPCPCGSGRKYKHCCGKRT